MDKNQRKTTHSVTIRHQILSESLKVVAPSWPLQQIVAVNPFCFQTSRNFFQQLATNARVFHQPLLMSKSFFIEKRKQGVISDLHLKDSIQDIFKGDVSIAPTIKEIDAFLHKGEQTWAEIRTISEVVVNPKNFDQIILDDIGRYCAGFFDTRQALIKYPWQNKSFLSGWLEAQKWNPLLKKVGMSQIAEISSLFSELDPEDIIFELLEQIGVSNKDAMILYMQRLLVSMIGWASRFKYVEWQKKLGYLLPVKSTCVELLAVRLLYDYALYKEFLTENKSTFEDWLNNLNQSKIEAGFSRTTNISNTLQWALEKSYQDGVYNLIRFEAEDSLPSVPKYQLAFCIDVRSEVIRRHIELKIQSAQTIGCAGFFGLPLLFREKHGSELESRAPVFVPRDRFFEKCLPEEIKREEENILFDSIRVIKSYFINFRKASIASFLYVELFGILALAKLLFNIMSNIFSKFRSNNDYNDKFYLTDIRSSLEIDTFWKSISLQRKVDQAEAILRMMGLTENFAKIIVLCAHGSKTVNNAQASSLDCGACGGHPGDVNAKLVALLLNDDSVRKSLCERDIIIPRTSVFVAAIHETVTDSLTILDQCRIPQTHRRDLSLLDEKLKAISSEVSKERTSRYSPILDKSAARRSSNWAETRPEWGLCGNAAFIVAPRSRTISRDLSGRAFLHDYDWHSDRDFQILRQILSGPLVVASWINLQYFFSVTSPDIFGSGNKLLHNISCESAVFEGNGDDLKFGLSLQSVFDGKNFVHEPLRLSVFIEAPEKALEDIFSENNQLFELVNNEWLHVFAIDTVTKVTRRRLQGGDYQEVFLGRSCL